MSETDMWEPDSGDLSDSHGYFIPMVDMMAGVVFILVVLLASVNLVSRDDFTEAAEASAEIQRIQAELDAARQIGGHHTAAGEIDAGDEPHEGEDEADPDEIVGQTEIDP